MKGLTWIGVLRVRKENRVDFEEITNQRLNDIFVDRSQRIVETVFEQIILLETHSSLSPTHLSRSSHLALVQTQQPSRVLEKALHGEIMLEKQLHEVRLIA